MRSVVQLYPGPPLYRGAVAQLGERLVCNQEATGSIPVSSTRKIQQREQLVEAVVLVHSRRFWILMIPVALAVAGLIGAIVETIKERRERKALIADGIDPDTVRKKAPTLR